MKSKTKIGKQVRRKTSSSLVDTILAAKKSPAWLKVASVLSSPRKNSISINLGDLDRLSKEGETILVPGKILSQGELNKKIKIVALKFSETAKEKLLKSKIQITSITDEIKNNPSAKGFRILTGVKDENN